MAIVGHIQTNSIFLQLSLAKLGSNQPPFVSDSLKTIEWQSPAGGQAWLTAIENGELGL